MNRYLTIVGLFFCLLPASSYAVKVPGLYEVAVPIMDQADASRQSAIETALRMVLVKLTGDRYAPGRTALAPLLKQAGNYVQQYRYKEAAALKADETIENPERLQLWVRFDEATLDRALWDLSVPVWGKERPSILIWLVVQDKLARQLIGLDHASDYTSVVEGRAALRGIALIFPLLDLEETSRVRASDIWGGFKEPVLAASSRYRVDSILTGSIEAIVPGIWEARWTAYIGGQTLTWVTEGDLPDVVLDEGIDGMADILAARFARTGIYAEEAGINIDVADIFSIDQYARVLKYLEALNSVTDVQVKRVEPGNVKFILTAHGGAQAVTQAIALRHLLEPISGQAGSAYRLLR